MSTARIPVTVVTGATGAGKTALIARLLRERPATQRWAVLQNDFGATGFESAAGVGEGAVAVRAVSGCMCCSGRVALRTALVALVRAARPHRLFIEASALAEPQSVLTVLREPGIKAALEAGPLVCAVSPRQSADARYRSSALYRAQIAAADVIVLGDGEEHAAAAQEEAERLARAGAHVTALSQVTLDTLRARPSEGDVGE